jgi:hypothetical protein
VTQQLNSGLGRLIVEVSRPHTASRILLTSDQFVAETATYTAHNKHKRRTSMPSAIFKPSIPQIKMTYIAFEECENINKKLALVSLSL